MRKLRLAIVGCGDIAGYTALFARLNRGIELAACCEVVPERLEAFSTKHRIPRVFESYEEMLDAGGFEAIYLATPHHLHYEMLKAAIERHVHVFAEKPVTRTLAEAIDVIHMAKRRGVAISVNYQYRFAKGCYALARAVQSGALGEVLYGRINLPWRREESYFTNAPWHASLAQSGGGTLLTQASHFVDLFLWACQGTPLAACGMTAKRRHLEVEVEDTAQAVVQLADGVLLQVCSSMAAAQEGAVAVEVYGSRGTGIYRDKPRPGVRFIGVKAKRYKPPIRGVHALARSLEDFRAWIIEGTNPLVPAESTLPALAVIEAIYRSAQSGRKEVVADYHV